MKEVKRFMAADGQEFTSKSAAASHEAWLNARKAFNDLAGPIFKAAPECFRLVTVMLGDPHNFIEVLKTYSKKVSYAARLADAPTMLHPTPTDND